MPSIANMMIPLMIILVGINAVLLFVTYLPADQQATHNLDYGMSEQEKAARLGDINGFGGDVQGLSNDANTTGIEATPNAISSLSTLAGIFLGGAVGYIVTGGNPFGAILGAGAGGVVGVFAKYFIYLAVGYFFWIDFFFQPLVANPTYGLAFAGLALLLKGLFAFIQLFGLLNIMIPLFAAGRR